MSTLADELLQDFEDSGSEGEEQHDGGLFPEEQDAKADTNGHALTGEDAMELDGDEEAVDEDDDMTGVDDTTAKVVEEDEEAMKAKVEKMQLKAVDDVRSVAGLMKTLEPVLEVSISFSPPLFNSPEILSLHLCACTQP